MLSKCLARGLATPLKPCSPATAPWLHIQRFHRLISLRFPAHLLFPQVRTRTNRSGGIQGGISNGEDIFIRVAFKPTSTIGTKQQTVSRDGQEVRVAAAGAQSFASLFPCPQDSTC